MFRGKAGYSAANYGEKIRFSPSSPLRFADFDLIHSGERQVSSERFPNGFRYFDFRAQNTNEEKTFFWSSGTGDIAPVPFSIGGKNYELELRMSDKLGKLAPNELIVWEK